MEMMCSCNTNRTILRVLLTEAGAVVVYQSELGYSVGIRAVRLI